MRDTRAPDVCVESQSHALPIHLYAAFDMWNVQLLFITTHAHHRESRTGLVADGGQTSAQESAAGRQGDVNIAK